MPDFDANRFFKAEFEAYYKDIPVPALTEFFDCSPETEKKLASAKKQLKLFQSKKDGYKSAADLELGIIRIDVVVLQWQLEKFGSDDDTQKQLVAKQAEIESKLTEPEVIRPNEDIAVLVRDNESKFANKADAISKIADKEREQNAIFRVKNPGSEVIGKVKNQAANSFKNQFAALSALVKEGSSLAETIEGFAKQFHVGESLEADFTIKLGLMTTACFYSYKDEWKPLDMPLATKISEYYPILFGELISEIYKAIGEGAVVKKPK